MKQSSLQKKMSPNFIFRLKSLLLCVSRSTDEEYNARRNKLQNETTQLKERLRETEARADNWVELAERAFDFATCTSSATIGQKG